MQDHHNQLYEFYWRILAYNPIMRSYDIIHNLRITEIEQVVLSNTNRIGGTLYNIHCHGRVPYLFKL